MRDCGIQRASISVVITTYNYARFIRGAIESVLGQTLQPTEIAVVDDGSTDDTADIVRPYLERGVRYIRQENRGAGAARNRGLRETSGELVAFLDSDDRWLPEKLALQADHLRRFPGVGFVTCGYWNVYESGRPAGRVSARQVDTRWAYPRILIENNIGNPSMVMARRSCFHEVGFYDEGLQLGQDWDMWIRLAKRFPLGIISEPLVLYLIHDDSLSRGKVIDRGKSNDLILKRYMSQVRSPLHRALLSRAAESMSDFYPAASMIGRPGQRLRSLRLAAHALWLDPFYKWDLKYPLLSHALIGPAAFSWLSKSIRTLKQIRGGSRVSRLRRAAQ